ncbi:MAG TPA: methyltransferase domain-containing protein, partial [Solirubrobacteraceae bacterium]
PVGLDTKKLRDEVSFIYARVAADPSGDFHFHRGPAYAAELLGYDREELARVPAESVASFAGVANPHRMGPLPAGATVVDVGCGAGMDLLLAARAVGPRGRAIGVDMTQAMAERARAAARAAGLENVSLDLIFGVPGETLAEWEQDVRAAIALAPAHVSAYALTYEEGTPFHAWRAARRLVPVTEDDEAAMADTTVAVLGAAGYQRYEISSFARPGREARHNLAYWDGSDYLGVGAGAHSFSREPSPGRRWMNERLPARYMSAAAARRPPIASEERLTEAQARAEFCFCGLRQTAGVDLGAFRRRFGVLLENAFPHVAGLVADGLAELTAGRLRLTARGLRYADTVAATFV